MEDIHMKSHRRILQGRDCDALHQVMELIRLRKQTARTVQVLGRNLKHGRRDKCSSPVPYLYISQFSGGHLRCLSKVLEQTSPLTALLSQESEITEDAGTHILAVPLNPSNRDLHQNPLCASPYKSVLAACQIGNQKSPSQPKRNP